MPKFLQFNEVVDPTRKTKVFAVVNWEGSILAWISFYPAWRKYCSHIKAENGVVTLDALCHREIADFCEDQTKLWRETLSAVSETIMILSFQEQCRAWVVEAFGEAYADSVLDRNHRFLEEALELVQACGCSQEDAHKLVDYVFGRPLGEKSQEAGGVMLTLAALCSVQNVNMELAGEIELNRARQPAVLEKIRAKQKAKPKFGPLPGQV